LAGGEEHAVPAEVAGVGLDGEFVDEEKREVGEYLMMWPGCLSSLTLGITSQWFSSLEVQKG
jgi:hypothetical protein